MKTAGLTEKRTILVFAMLAASARLATAWVVAPAVRRTMTPSSRIVVANRAAFMSSRRSRMYGADDDDDDDEDWSHGRRKNTRRQMKSYDSDDDDDGWSYKPYEEKKKSTRPKKKTYDDDDDWVVPNKIQIPMDRIELSYSRSSGAGGQNVNKLSTKADVKMHVPSADWLPEEVRERLAEQQATKMSKDGYLVMYSQEYRTQAQNRKDVISKLQTVIRQAYLRPKIRKQYEGISNKSKERNIEQKRRRSMLKASRSRVDW